MNRGSDFDTAVSRHAGGTMTGGTGAGATSRLLCALKEWRRVSRSRRELAGLDDYQLRDIGLSRSQALFESDKSFLRK